MLPRKKSFLYRKDTNTASYHEKMLKMRHVTFRKITPNTEIKSNASDSDNSLVNIVLHAHISYNLIEYEPI